MSILLIGEQRFGSYLQTTLSNHKLNSFNVACINKATSLIKEKFYRVIICTTPFGDLNNESLFRHLKENSPESKVIFISEDISVNSAIDLAKEGLFSCLKKPFLIEDLLSYINEANSISLPDKKFVEKESVKVPTDILNDYVKGISEAASEMNVQIELIAPTNFNVIIYGETGTGKESVAHRVAAAQNKNAPFVAVDCGCLSKELALSELFGHEKGAFTGALNTKKGAFEQADNGTLFLDEIGNLDYEIQTYLLRALQERKIKKVGGEKEFNFNVRIIVASNENLSEKVKKEEFREDLFHRLNEFEIIIPPLRERTNDLDLFIKYFIDEVNSELNKNVLGVDSEAFESLLNYDWPGNVRELKNTIRRACLLTNSDHYISKDAFSVEISQPNVHFVTYENLNDEFKTGEDPTTENTHNYLKKLMEKAELNHIREILKKVNYNKTKAALLLDIDRKTLYNKLKRMQLLY